MPTRHFVAYTASFAELGKRFRARRVELGLKKGHAARHAEVDWSYIHRIEHGNTIRPSPRY